MVLKQELPLLLFAFVYHFSIPNQLHMKRHLLLTLGVIAISFASQAQITKGTVLLGGTVGASTYTTETFSTKYKARGFTLSPSAGFTVKDNHVVGISLTYGHGSTKSTYTDLTNDTYGAGVFYRRYLPLGKSFYFYGQADARYSYFKSDFIQDPAYKTSNEQKFGRLSLSPGITYAVSKRFHLEVAMNDIISLNYNDTQYHWISSSDSRYDKNKGFNFESHMNLSTDLVIGFRILLGKQHKG